MNSRTIFRTKSRPVWLAPLAATLGIVAFLGTVLGPSTAGQRSQALAKGNGKEPVVAKTLFGFTPFPYDQSLEALAKTHQIVTKNSTIYALHFDDGIPWKEALADTPLPKRVQRSWDDQTRTIPKGHRVYLGLAPLDKDRRSLAPARGEQDGAATPMELRNARLDDSKVKQAYLNYARRAVRQFKPDFLNLGIEAGGVLMRDSARWAQFQRLYDHVRSSLKREFPDLQIGISFSLGHLRVEASAKAARSLIAKSDYVGLSFYPSASPFDEKYGLPPYGSGADAWRKPLAWVRAYTDKPIALCETGYTTLNCDVPQFDLHIKGDPQSQAEYVRDLFEIADRDRYAFVIWFLAVDYDKLYARMPPGSEVMQLWRNIGLWDGELRPKPAWEIWQKEVVQRRKGADNPRQPRSALKEETKTTRENQGIEGTWSVVLVELAGKPLEGLNGARLAMTGGRKTFTMPSGAVEKGTYVVDGTKTPKQIDATTDGKAGTQTGIYAISGDTLRLCLAQQGRQRPEEFATQKDSDSILIVLKRHSAQPAAAPVAAKAPGSKPVGARGFRMGFTGFAYDMTPEAVTASRKFVRENGDILAHHIEGVPWAEALADLPFPKAFLDGWEGKKAATPPGGKVYLAISPGRGELKVAEKCLPLPRELQGKAYDDPLVKKAFLNYSRRAIEFFRPDYLAIGIEVNEIFSTGPAKWEAYVTLHQHVYAELKKQHKDMPVFASFTLHNMFKHRGTMLAEFQRLMPFNDLVAVSYYPFFMGEADRLSALDWLMDNFDQFRKPYAMVETNDAAERLEFPRSKLIIDGNPAKQLAYYEKLLALAQKRRFVFVISFIHQDYDALWEKIKDSSPELFIAWRDCGLLDEKGGARPAYRVWKDYLALPLKD